MPNQGKRWEPSSEVFEKFLSVLHADRDQAGVEYELLRVRLLTYFERRACPVADWLADEVLNRLMRRLAEGEQILEPARYAYGIAKWIWVEYQKKAQREASSLDDLPPIPVEWLSDWMEQDDAQHWQKRLYDCLNELPEKDRALLVQYLCQEDLKNKEARKELADALQLSALALRLRVHRLKARLAECFKSQHKS